MISSLAMRKPGAYLTETGTHPVHQSHRKQKFLFGRPRLRTTNMRTTDRYHILVVFSQVDITELIVSLVLDGLGI